jgi:hypothetical protein
MTTPIEEIESYLAAQAALCPTRRRQLAILFAQAMVFELRTSTNAWEATVRELETAVRAPGANDLIHFGIRSSGATS